MNKASRCSLDKALNCRASNLTSISIGTYVRIFRGDTVVNLMVRAVGC